MVTGYQATGLQGGTDDPRLVVDLTPRHERPRRGRGHRRADETNPGRPIGGGDDPIDDPHVRRRIAGRHDLQP